MNHTGNRSDPSEVQAISDLYQKASHELLQAYQRNKEATRHHASGAFRAALHHARLSCVHSCAAHEHLVQALQRATDMPTMSPLSNNAVPLMGMRGHRDAS